MANLLTALSLLLCLTAAVMWVRNLWSADHVVYRRSDAAGRAIGLVSVYSWWGSLVVDVSRLDRPLQSEEGEAFSRMEYGKWYADPRLPPFDERSVRIVAGFGWGGYRYAHRPRPSGSAPVSGTARVVMVPWYALVVAAAVMPIARARRAVVRRKRLKSGLCPACGYDLRESEGACPECGIALVRLDP